MPEFGAAVGGDAGSGCTNMSGGSTTCLAIGTSVTLTLATVTETALKEKLSGARTGAGVDPAGGNSAGAGPGGGGGTPPSERRVVVL